MKNMTRSPLLLWIPPIIAIAAVMAVFYSTDFNKKSFPTRQIDEFTFSMVMGTDAHVTIRPSNNLKLSSEEIARRAYEKMKLIEKLMTRFDNTSDVGRINTAPPGKMIPVAPLTWQAMMEAARFNRLSDGAFDVTIGSIMNIYRWSNQGVKSIPPQNIVDSARAKCGFDKLIFEREGMKVGKTTDGLIIDLGGIAKGMAVDYAIEELKKHGVKDALVEIGGEVRIIGQAPITNDVIQRIGGEISGRAWGIAIRNPRSADTIKSLSLSGDGAVATSGDYEKFFEFEGKHYSHIVDPRTGYPVTGGVISATLISPNSCMKADALATTLCVLGVDKARELLKHFPEIEAVLVLEDGSQVTLNQQEHSAQ